MFFLATSYDPFKVLIQIRHTIKQQAWKVDAVVKVHLKMEMSSIIHPYDIPNLYGDIYSIYIFFFL